MKRIKGLVLAATLAAALLALPAAASAGGFEADAYPAELHGAPQGSFSFQLPGTPVNVTRCAPAFDATLSRPYPDASTTSTSATCESKWNVQNCQLTFHPGSGTLDIGPSGCGPTLIQSGVCFTTQIPAQTGLAATYANTGSGSEAAVLVEVHAKSVEYTQPGGGSCKGGTYNNGVIEGTWKITAKKAGKTVGVSTFSGPAPIGIFMAGGPAKFGTGTPRLDAEQFPVNVVGERWDFSEAAKGKLVTFQQGAIKVECPVGTFSLGELAGPINNSLVINADFHGKVCPVGNLGNGEVKMNSCHYVLAELEQEVEGGKGTSQYVATPKIECDTVGDAIKIWGPGCTISLPSQTLSGPVPVLQNIGEGYKATIGSVIAGSSVKYTTNNTLACKLAKLPASGEDGSTESDVLFRGAFPG